MKKQRIANKQTFYNGGKPTPKVKERKLTEADIGARKFFRRIGSGLKTLFRNGFVPTGEVVDIQFKTIDVIPQNHRLSQGE